MVSIRDAAPIAAGTFATATSACSTWRSAQGLDHGVLVHPQKGWERVVTGSTTADSLGVLTTLPRPAGTGLWVEGADHATAAYVTQAGGAGQVVQINGSLVGGDAQAAYTDVRSNAAGGATEEQLWRYPIDGSAATKIPVAPTVDGSSLDYTGDPLPASDGKGVLKLWLTHALLPQQPAPVLLQWTPLP